MGKYETDEILVEVWTATHNLEYVLDVDKKHYNAEEAFTKLENLKIEIRKLEKQLENDNETSN